ncbi:MULTISPECIES: type II toxin-antitoxin system ParD family antitoxin [Agrobacterium]|uniref:Type II toxin-antitoxin system ParD family antitoxin n=1 Tax=Agrobacterium tumefaciens TaxID=358 RepID=A0AAE6B8Y6_AGRTU|nr:MULTISPECIES: type II toxin-antitoxin system ParD family antitoxin [Agrobacterium]QCL72495.1 type II toxin-antitoxin system ParD family antitoxin [Agrobacterium tumefaciens]QCL78067.1 type II toxin-antitoxin system ParD family antitoxin [Agrobacterium tumefaciens]CUX18420.1 Antitoxin ParD4 [Agrobacterium sp. NCPPB 925]
MATMNISLPGQMKDWVEAQSKTGRYSNASDYVRDLIRRDQERGEKITAMQRLVDEGLQSGTGDRSQDALFAEAEARSAKRDIG